MDETDFLIKSALGVSFVSCLILLPFGMNNFMQGRMVGGIFTIFASLLFAINAFIGWRGRYSLRLNLFGVVPAFTLGATNAVFTLQVAGSYWSYLCVFAIYFILPFRYSMYANIVFVIAVVGAAWGALEPSIFLRFSTVLIGASAFIFISKRETTRAQILLRRQAITDPLTGTLNRVEMPVNLENAIAEFSQNKIKSTLCVIDIDHFKNINDTYGHDAGDTVLIGLSTFISSQISSKDKLFRIGGEEFLILMTDTDEDEGRQTADALRATVEDLPLLKGHQVTISIGVTEVEATYNWKKWMKRSDEKLYLAKQNGRNLVVV